MDRPQLLAKGAGTRAARAKSLASCLLSTAVIMAGARQPVHGTRRRRARYACGAPGGEQVIFAPVPMLQTVLAASGTGSYGLFYTLLVLHVAAGLTGFASIGLAGTYAGRASQFGATPDQGDLVTDQADRAADRTGPAADEPSGAPEGTTSEELVRYFRRPAGLWWALLAVPWLGLGALAAEPHGGGVAQAWDLGAFVLWAAAAVVAALAVVPALHRIRSALVRPAASGGPGTVGPVTSTPPPGPGWPGPHWWRAAVRRCATCCSSWPWRS